MQHYSSNFDEVEHQETVFPSQVSTSGGAGAVGGSSLDTSIPEVFQAPPTPLPYDSDLRHLRNARDGQISRRDKSGMSQQSMRISNSDGGGTALQSRFGNNGGTDQEEQAQGLKSGVVDKNAPPSKAFSRVESALSMLDDDDVCPTCLDGIHYIHQCLKCFRNAEFGCFSPCYVVRFLGKTVGVTLSVHQGGLETV